MTATDWPRPLVSPDWLQANLGTVGLVIIDATIFPVSLRQGGRGWISAEHDYRTRGHLPGAVYGDQTEDFIDLTSNQDLAQPTAEQFARAAGRLGIDRKSRVVIYDAARGQWAARLWWLFRLFGHDDVGVLDGGFSNWVGEKRPIITGQVTRPVRVYEVSERPAWRAQRSELETPTIVKVVPRADDAAGDDSIGRAQEQVPDSSVFFDLAATLDPVTKKLRPQDVVRQQAEATLAGHRGRIVGASPSGISAARILLLLDSLGYADLGLLQLNRQ